ncbi:MAG: sigma 54-interacting transcriptional regulator [Desulfobacula sp.]|jgi:transcriptional regulator with PAS, ATPase and Fis domain
MSTTLSQRTDFFSVWNNFVKTGDTRNVPSHIRASWERSRKFGVNPLDKIFPEVVSQSPAKKINQENEDLHKLIQYHCRDISNKTDLSVFNISFSGPDGCVISIGGHDKISRISDNSEVSIGFNLSEGAVGTTAPGISLVELRPSMVHAEEHFSKIFHWATCFAVPIFNHKNKIAGCLNISTTTENRHKLEHTALFFYNLANSFQFEHFIKKKFQELKMYSSFFDSTFKYADKNLVLIDNDMDIINLNAKAMASFGINSFELNNNIIRLFDMDAGRFNAVLDNKGIDTFDLRCRGDYTPFSIKALPIYDSSGNETSYLLELEPEKKKFVLPDKSKNQARFTFNHIIGNSTPITNIITKAKKAAKSGSNILIEGKTGTGKELFAQAVHSESRFSDGPFIAINCSAIPNELVESELFGYEKGSYTGALRSGSTGKFEMANNGTIFLDEIQTMSLPAQMKILRTIEDRSVVRVGGKAPISLNLRIIAATSENIEKEVENGRFLSALFFRINVVRLQIPELKDRKEDIPLLIDYFIREMNRQFGNTIKGMDEEALKALLHYSWPGNIRELKNAVESGFNFCDGHFIDLDSLNIPFSGQTEPLPAEQKSCTMDSITKQILKENLERFGNVTDAAAFLGIPVSTFYRRMKKFGLSK